MIIVAIGDVLVEGYSGKEVVNLFKSISKPTTITFRDPTLFMNKLDSSSLLPNNTSLSINDSIGVVTNTNNVIIETTINYANKESISIERLNLNEFQPSLEHAKVGDVIEIEYSLQVLKNNDVSENKGESI